MSEEVFYFPDKLQFQENSEFIALNYEWVGVGKDHGTESQEETETFVNNLFMF